MMSMSAINNIDYYLDMAAEDYYVSGGEPPGQWFGIGARILGLRGEVNAADYHAIMLGKTPKGIALCENPGTERRVGWDLTFSPPKSVSVLWARGDDRLREQLQDAQRHAVHDALRLLEQHAAITRRGHDGVSRESVEGFLIATFEHATSREMDPQLHTHCLVMNVAPRRDGTWGSIDSRPLFQWQRAASSLYRASLAKTLRELNLTLDVAEHGESFEICGVPQTLCAEFSKRANAINAALAKAGATSSASALGDAIKLSTRQHKTAVDRPALHQHWGAIMDERGFTQADAMQLQHGRDSLLDNALDGLLDSEAVLDQLMTTRAVFRAQDSFQVAAELALFSSDSVATLSSIAKESLQHREVFNLGRDYAHNMMFTTQMQLDAERAMIKTATQLRRANKFGIDIQQLNNVLQNAQFTLSDEQREAVLDVCDSQHFAILQGSAGAGKSTAMRCVNDAYKHEGFQVIGASVAKAAADNLQRETNIPSMTIAKLLSDIERGRNVLTARTVLIIDEAGQLGTPQLAQLMKATQQANSKIILVGEDKQLDAITHGGSLRYLSRPDVMGATRIQTIRRQREIWARQAVANLRDGNMLAALSAFAEHKLISIHNDHDDARRALVERWHHFQTQTPDKTTLVIAQRWGDVLAISQHLRTLLQAEDRIANDQVMMDCVVSTRTMRLPMAVGDRVRLTHNDYAQHLTNGLTGTLTNIVQKSDDIVFTIKSDDGRMLTISRNSYCDNLQRLHMVHAYAATIYSSQGLTVDETFVLHDERMDRANSYVAGSRHRDKCHWFFNRSGCDLEKPELPQFAESMARDQHQKLALEYCERLETKIPSIEKLSSIER